MDSLFCKLGNGVQSLGTVFVLVCVGVCAFVGEVSVCACVSACRCLGSRINQLYFPDHSQPRLSFKV